MATVFTRRILESPLYQGEDEQLSYTLTTTNWVSSPTSPSVVIKDSDGTDVTTSVTSGSASATGDVITTPRIQSLTAGEKYRFEIKWVVSGNTYEAWADLYGQQ